MFRRHGSPGIGQGSSKGLKYVAIALAAAWIGWTAMDAFFVQDGAGTTAYREGDQFFENGDYRAALGRYDQALAEAPDSPAYVRAKALALMQLGRNEAALRWFTRAAELQPFFGGTYANRGRLYERIGKYRKAVSDYEKALTLRSPAGDIPVWLARFRRSQPVARGVIADRLAHLKARLAKPRDRRPKERLESGAKQRSDKQ